MKKNIFKYIFITMFAICISFVSVTTINAESKTVNIGTKDSDIFYAEKNIWGNYVLYVYLNTVYGDATDRAYYKDILMSVCETGKTNSIVKDNNSTMKCAFSDIKEEVVINYSPSDVPLSLVYDTNSDSIKNLLSGCFCYKDTDDNTVKFVCKEETCSKFCTGTCEEVKINYLDEEGGYLSLKTCKTEELKKNLFFKYAGMNASYSSWADIGKTHETFTSGGDKYFSVFSNDGTCHAFSKTTILERYDDSMNRSGKPSSETGSAFFDDWDSIPAVLNGMTDIIDKELTCTDSSMAGLLSFLKKIYLLIKIGAFALLILLSAMDFMSAVASADDKKFPEAVQRSVKRIVITVAIILLPSIIDLIFKIVTISQGSCGIS